MDAETIVFEVQEYEGYFGLVATEHIYQGATILELPENDYLFEPDRYSLQIAPGLHVDCKSSPAGAINHCCEPNARLRGTRIVAWRCIEAGEEITLDYRLTEDRMAEPFTCNCGWCEEGTIIRGKD